MFFAALRALKLATLTLTATAVAAHALAQDSAVELHAADLRTAQLSFEHPQIALRGEDARWQLLLTARTVDEQTRDATRLAAYRVEPPIAAVDEHGYVTPLRNGAATIRGEVVGCESATLQLEISDMQQPQTINFPNRIVPIFTKFGCNGGGCHGKSAGQAGFKLSLLGFEPREDYEHLVIESRGRRLFPAAPAKSLLLEKAINASPHGGGQRLTLDSHEYRLLHRWIASGMPYGSDEDPTVAAIEVVPQQRRLTRGASQQLVVLAHYSDGSVEDITRTAQYESNNTDLATVDESGWVTLGDQPGTVAVMARYQGQVTVFRAGIPLGVEISQWPKTRNLVDELVFAKLATLGIPPSQECDDSTFIRRATLDLCGRLPTLDETRRFLDAAEETKFEALIDGLLASTEHAEYFAKKWSAILRNRRAGSGHTLGTFAFYQWLRTSLHENKPYDKLVRELLTATGSVESNPPVAWLREVSGTESRIEDAAQLFLGQRIQCARCHHHPFEKWSQTDYFQMAAFFSKVVSKPGLTPEAPIFVSRSGGASARHPRSGDSLQPAGLGSSAPLRLESFDDPRQALVDWMVAADNPFFAKSLVNRYWKHFFAIGMVEPEDDMRVTNPPSNPELLDGLSEHFVASGYDLKQLLRLICSSSTYRLTAEANPHNLDDRGSYSRFYPRRLQAEVLLDAVDHVAMTHTDFAGMPDGTRAVSLPDNGFSSYFLDAFGRPAATTACECERSEETTLAQSLHLLNSKEVQAKLSSDSGRAAAMAASSEPLQRIVNDLYLEALSREATPAEQQTAAAYLQQQPDRRRAFEDLVWAMINSKEFVFNH